MRGSPGNHALIKRLLTVVSPLAVAALLSGCATSDAHRAGLRPLVADRRPAAPDEPPSVNGLFLAGAVALNAGSGDSAAEMFAGAAAADPDDTSLKQRAFTANLVAGRVTRAAQLSPGPGEAGDGLVNLGRLTQAVEALAEGRNKAAQTLLAAIPPTGAHASAARLTAPWIAVAAGDTRAAAPPEPGGDRLILPFQTLGRARLAERAGRFAVADPLFKGLTASRDGLFTQAYGGFLERRGRRAEAVKLYDLALQRTADDIALQRARARASGASAPPQPTIKEGAAEALVGPAAALSIRREGDRGLSYLRLALRLDPHRAPLWLMVGEALEAAGDVESARRAYGEVAPGEPEHPTALTRLALLRQKADDAPGALELARQAYAEAPTDPQAMVTYAELLRIAKRYDEAIAILDKLIAKMGKSQPAAKLYFLRAAALERAGKWPQAESDLKQSLAIDPNDAEVQNYLGYAWADRGEHLPEAVALLRKAVAASPGQGALLDSLGWAYFRSGDTKAAVIDLERAVALEPADAAIVDHLGDAYWRIGRSLEARYQWNRVLTLDPEDDVKARATQKLKDGGPTTARATPPAPVIR